MKRNGPSISVFPSPLAAVFSLGLVVVLAGCALWSKELITYHSFDYPSPVKETLPPIPGTLMVYRFLPAPSVDIDSLVIAASSGNEKAALLHRWEDNPADMITELVLRDLDSSGLFEKTVDQLSSARYRYALEGIIRNLQGTITDGKGKALIDIEATLIDFEARGSLEKNLLKKLYKIEVASPDAKPDSIIKALNLAVKEFSDRLRDDIRAAVEPKVPEPEKKAPRKITPLSPGRRRLRQSLCQAHCPDARQVVTRAMSHSGSTVKGVTYPRIMGHFLSHSIEPFLPGRLRLQSVPLSFFAPANCSLRHRNPTRTSDFSIRDIWTMNCLHCGARHRHGKGQIV